MAHIALIITGLTGKLNASFEMASRLQKEGHRVTYLCPFDVREKVEFLGFEYQQLPDINFDFKDMTYDLISSKGWVDRFLFHFKNLSDHFSNGYRILNIDNYKKALNELNPDKVLVDMELHELIFTAIDLKIPVTLFSSWFSNRLSTKLPPLRSSLTPDGNTVRIIVAWAKVKSRAWARLFFDKLMFKNYRRATLKKYARKIAFDTSELVTSNFPPLFSYTKTPIVTITMKELEFPHKPNQNLRYLGPMVFAKRDDDSANATIILSEVFEQKKVGKKIIYCTLGSFKKADISFLKNLIKAVENQDDYFLMISLGKLIHINELGNLPDNVRAFNWLPQLKILQQSDCCINHGGTHTVYECVHFSVPMLVYSGKNFDQNGTAARIAYHGLGIMGDKDLDGPIEINSNITDILSNNSFTEKMSEIHKKYELYRELDIYPLLN